MDGNTMQLRFLDGQEEKFRRRKKTFGCRIIFSTPRRILAQLTEAVSVKVVLRGVGKRMAFYRNKERRRKIYRYQISPRFRKRRTKPDLWPIS